MAIYATGSTGYIGTQLSNSVIPIDIDLSKVSSMKRLKLKPKSTIIHLASIVGESRVREDQEYSRKVNVLGAEILAEIALSQNVSRFIYVSSSHVYAKSNNPVREGDEIAPSSLYAEQKLEAENRILRLFSNELQSLCIARVFSVLGKNMKKGTLGWSIDRAHLAKVKYGMDQRDFLSPKQIAQVIFDLANIVSVPNIINVATGIPTSIRNATRTMRGIQDDKELDLYCENNVSDSPYIVGDPNLLRSVLDSAPHVWSLEK
jgi:nucleoside-diphosphate-sugar epimerase